MQGAEPPGKPVLRRLSRRGCRGASPPRLSQCRPGLAPARGCKGRSPLHEITLVSPFPLGRGSGGWGQKSTDAAEKASAARVQPRECKGRSPLHKKTKKSPPSPEGKGVGGWGKENKLKAWSAGGKEGKPPPDTGTPPSFVSRETSPLPCSVSRETSPPPFHVKHSLPCFT